MKSGIATRINTGKGKGRKARHATETRYWSFGEHLQNTMRALRPERCQSSGTWFEKTLILAAQNDKKDRSKSKKVCVQPAENKTKTKNNYYHHFSSTQRPHVKLHWLVVDELHHIKSKDADRSHITQRLSFTFKNVWLGIGNSRYKQHRRYVCPCSHGGMYKPNEWKRCDDYRAEVTGRDELSSGLMSELRLNLPCCVICWPISIVLQSRGLSETACE